MGVKLSLIIGAYDMPRELPRTIRSLSPLMQREIDPGDYEIIVVDNGSRRCVDIEECRSYGASLRVIRIEPTLASRSPVRALNAAVAEACGGVVGVMIDGARMASPGILSAALRASRLGERVVALTLGFHLGDKVQMQSVRDGYDAAEEDRLLESIDWPQDGYRLFEISAFAGSSQGGWFRPINESNAIFTQRAVWDEVGGFDERFASAGGGFANLDLLSRAVTLRDVRIVTILGEGTFHQVHGGVATNGLVDLTAAFAEEFARVRGVAYRSPIYESHYIGELPRISRSPNS